MQLRPEERMLFIIHDHTVYSRTRLQKYGFLLHEQYKSELKEIQSKYSDFEFYDDWKPHYFGPYSKTLQEDLAKCIENELVHSYIEVQPYYALTIRGRVRWRELYAESPDQVKELYDKIAHIQKYSLPKILKIIYDTYPEYTKKCTIKDQLS